jgi:hypothetical protein
MPWDGKSRNLGGGFAWQTRSTVLFAPDQAEHREVNANARQNQPTVPAAEFVGR